MSTLTWSLVALTTYFKLLARESERTLGLVGQQDVSGFQRGLVRQLDVLLVRVVDETSSHVNAAREQADGRHRRSGSYRQIEQIVAHAVDVDDQTRFVLLEIVRHKVNVDFDLALRWQNAGAGRDGELFEVEAAVFGQHVR